MKSKSLYWSITSLMTVLFGSVFFILFYTMIKENMFEAPLAIVLITIIVAIVLVFSSISYFVYKDAPNHGLEPWLWMTIATYVPNFIGLIVYFIMRNNKKKVCGKCSNAFSKELKTCPYCGHDHRLLCPQCKGEVEDDWRVCPHCKEHLPQTSKEVKKSTHAPLIIAVMAIIVLFISFFTGIFISDASPFNEFAIGRVANKTFNSTQSSHMFLTETESKRIHLDEGEKLVVTYECESEKGTITLKLLDEDQKILEVVKEPRSGTLKYEATNSGHVYILLEVKESKGKYKISWEKL